MKPIEAWEVLNRPYMHVCELVKLTRLSRYTVQAVLKENAVPKYPRWGYVTEDIIKAFRLEQLYDRLAETYA